MDTENENMPGSYAKFPRNVTTPIVEPATGGKTMPVLTIWQPWAVSIIHGPKRYENRGWTPPPSLVGRRLAIHASVRQPDLAEWDSWQAVAEQARRWGQDVPQFRQMPLDYGAIIGTVLVTGFIDVRRAMTMPDPWVVGPFAWVLADPRPCVPVRCKGAQKLWSFDEETVRQADRLWHANNPAAGRSA